MSCCGPLHEFMTNSTKVSAARQAPCYWLTGLPGAGKSTLARAFAETLRACNSGVVLLDGDELRKGLNSDLGFSRADRAESLRRAAEVARIATQSRLVAIVAHVSPYREDRERARQIVGREQFVEVFVDADLPTCVARDPKGMYQKAQAGIIPDFTGLTAPYDAPEAPDLHIATATQGIEQSVNQLLEHHAMMRGVSTFRLEAHC